MGCSDMDDGPMAQKLVSWTIARGSLTKKILPSCKLHYNVYWDGVVYRPGMDTLRIYAWQTPPPSTPKTSPPTRHSARACSLHS